MSKPRGYRITVSREGWCYLGVITFIFLGALIRDINLLVLLVGLLIGLLVYSWIAVVISLRRIEVKRTAPREVVAGEPFDVTISLVNRKRWFSSWGVAVDDPIEHLTGGAPGLTTGGVLFLCTRAGETAEGAYRVCLGERGKYRFGPLAVSTRFPLGLIRRSMIVDTETSLIVLPRLGQMRPGWARPNPAIAHASRSSDRRQGPLEGDFIGLREWRSGDSGRWIHWRTTARKGELMVRQFERHQNHDLAVLVDLWQPAQPQDKDLERVELAVSLAATMVREMCRRGGGQVWLAAAERELSLMSGATSLAFFGDAIEKLALVQGRDHNRAAELITLAAREIPSSARSVLITTRGQALEQVRATMSIGPDQGEPFWDRVETIDVASDALELHFYLE